ncbi:peptidase C14 [Cordyceps fumosorosea ARSEF 2679]|uniref:Peptidase C14 n=1 Tax=Cordyceps fumosorosea (strain ARSEF 2679) TaxID=1081104 RepID=A0A167GBS2_CORFA|nr:peptidase C14 [Cordyceps fumosorosea ARSEF 2679]OAA46421.1 peptidase C14 [Cordyceps fumosorosea ARSEF 2679]
MKFAAVVMLALAAPFAAAFGPRGFAERYSSEQCDMLPWNLLTHDSDLFTIYFTLVRKCSTKGTCELRRADEFPDTMIWSFAHDSNWLIDAPVKTTEEIGRCLLKQIREKRLSPHLPIIFIGHSLGGIIIKQALRGRDSQDIVDDTAGVIFLGAPHQGSSVSGAGAVLASATGFLGSDTTLLLSLNNHGVVSRDSSNVHADADESHSIETDLSGLNKRGGPTDTLFTKLAAAIRRLKTPSLLEQADTQIRNKHYTADRLKIKRLSGEPLLMDQCYINLAIVEQSGRDADYLKTEGDIAPSPFSICARQKVEASNKTLQLELAAIFNERDGSDGRPMHP